MESIGCSCWFAECM